MKRDEDASNYIRINILQELVRADLRLTSHAHPYYSRRGAPKHAKPVGSQHKTGPTPSPMGSPTVAASAPHPSAESAVPAPRRRVPQPRVHKRSLARSAPFAPRGRAPSQCLHHAARRRPSKPRLAHSLRPPLPEARVKKETPNRVGVRRGSIPTPPMHPHPPLVWHRRRSEVPSL